ncbi:DinB family protein [Larkinella punicea]|uniref:DinB family protein n=1 Tax=Larkinella punicea TaxID=2315727 RepID=A0A368JXK1_9BACT|nr:DinB family protein [Larkinella punicea]RCR70941.1 DinB family protein [Larkinella punicea]
MPAFQPNDLLGQLARETQTLVELVLTEFSPLSVDELNHQPAPDRWSIAQCLDHLNSYGHYYLPQLEAAVLKGEKESIRAASTFRSGWLGNYFANSMRPKADGSIGLKMKAVKEHTPVSNLNASAVLAVFLEQQHALLELLERAKVVNIQKLRIPISIARFIRLSVGDTFRFLIAHEQRHVLQARRVSSELILRPNVSVES